MPFTDIFIHRPIAAMVVSMMILLLGLNAFRVIELRQFPKLEQTTITINTAYPGASAKLVQGFITAPIQQAVASIVGLDYVTSSTQQGLSTVTMSLELGANSNNTMVEVLSAMARVKGVLPVAATAPVVSRKTGSSDAVLYLSFYSEQMTPEQVTEYVSREIQTRLQTINGVGSAEISGAKNYSMRIWLDQNSMASYNLDAIAVVTALRANNHLASIGATGGGFVTVDLEANTDLQDEAGFKRLVIARQGEQLIRLQDVARVEMAAADTTSGVIYKGRPAVLVGIQQTTKANPLDVAKRVRDSLIEIRKQMPSELKVDVVYDVSININASIDEVIKTLIEAVLIVIAVVFLFLGSLRSVIIPIITIPLSLIGVLFLMQMLGFSINLLTLLAMVLAVGLVVDDAIVMVENVSRHISEGKTPFDAALEGAQEIAQPVVSMTLTLAAVYAPIGLMGGLTGALFKEFAFTLAASVVISGVVALTLSPVMCAKMLKAQDNSLLERIADRVFASIQGFYEKRLINTIKYRPAMLIIIISVFAAIPYLLYTSTSELAPVEDQGVLMISGSAPKSSSFDFIQLYSEQIGAIIDAIPESEGYFLINGSPAPNSMFGIQILKTWENRERTQSQIQPALQAALEEVPGLSLVTFPMPSLPGSSGGMPFQFVISGNTGFDQLYEAAESLKQKMMATGLFAYIDIDLKFNTPVASIDVDRELANDLGLTMESIGAALSFAFSGAYVDNFDHDEHSYKVIPQYDARWRLTPEKVNSIQVKTELGDLIPLEGLIDISRRVGPNSLSQYQQLNSATISAVFFPGVSMGDAIQEMEKVAAGSLSAGYLQGWKGESRAYIREGNTLFYIFGFALLVIFMVLAAQFNSLRDPFIVLLTVPMAIAGALIPINMGFCTLNIYTQIGLVTLIGLISKQGIMMVEFANHLQQEQKLDVNQSIIKASVIRLRPILMTAAAIVIGIIPLVIAQGAGAAGRQSLGLVIFSGMFFGTLLCLFTLPVIYSYLAEKQNQ